MRVAYILGYGRSGSTVLDLILGSLPSCTSVGEISNLYEWRAAKRPCACGKELDKCDQWSGILESHEQAGGGSTKLLRSVEGLLGLFQLLWGTPNSRRYREYKKSVESLFDSIARHRGVTLISDSSKSTRATVGRFLALQKLTKYDVKGVFLVRDGRGVMWSEMKRAGSPEHTRRSRSRFVNATRCALSWTMTNILSLLVKSVAAKDSVLLMRYEDLCQTPVESIRRLAEFLDLSLDPAVLEGEIQMKAGHTVAGNRLRFASELRLKPDTEWMSKLPNLYRNLFWIITFPVARRLGYAPGSAKGSI